MLGKVVQASDAGQLEVNSTDLVYESLFLEMFQLNSILKRWYIHIVSLMLITCFPINFIFQGYKVTRNSHIQKLQYRC